MYRSLFSRGTIYTHYVSAHGALISSVTAGSGGDRGGQPHRKWLFGACGVNMFNLMRFFVKGLRYIDMSSCINPKRERPMKWLSRVLRKTVRPCWSVPRFGLCCVVLCCVVLCCVVLCCVVLCCVVLCCVVLCCVVLCCVVFSGERSLV